MPNVLTKGGASSSLKVEYNTNNNYDYIEDKGTLPVDGQDSAAIYQEAVSYHAVGPDVVKPAQMAATKTGQSRSTGYEITPNLYEAPTKQKFRVSALKIFFTPHTLNIVTLRTSRVSNSIISLVLIREQAIMKCPNQKMFSIQLDSTYPLL